MTAPLSPAVYLVVSGAGPTADIALLLTLAGEAGWTVCVTATGAGAAPLDVAQVAPLSPYPLRLDYEKPSPLWPPADLVIVAPATFNTLNKLAAGIADSIGLSLIAECLGLDVPTVVAPSLNPALARHPRYRASVEQLRSWGVQVLEGPRSESPGSMRPWSEIVRAGGAQLRRPLVERAGAAHSSGRGWVEQEPPQRSPDPPQAAP
ncbi:MAG TPA: flavoprotein [Actinomycetota bacterium]|nr:flavoprotein [Actinomycetota bacterium]